VGTAFDRCTKYATIRRLSVTTSDLPLGELMVRPLPAARSRARRLILGLMVAVFVGGVAGALALFNLVNPDRSVNPRASTTLSKSSRRSPENEATLELHAVGCWSTRTCVITGGGLYRTIDGGTIWTVGTVRGLPKTMTPIDFQAVACPSMDHCISVGDRGFVITSDDGGGTWVAQRPLPSVDNLTGIACPSARFCYGVGVGGRSGAAPLLISTTDGGTRWKEHAVPGNVSELEAIACSGLTTCFVFGSSSSENIVILRTQNGGGRWDQGGVPGGVGLVWSASCPSANECFGATGDGVIVTTDGGAIWELLHSRLGLGVSCPTVRICVAVGFQIHGDAAATTLDGGRTWIDRSTPAHLFKAVSVSCPSPTTCVAAGWGPQTAAIMTTSDGGRSWVSRAMPGTVLPVGPRNP
jgi:photosystem II stability/assembly factor-like uncharacterized protein